MIAGQPYEAAVPLVRSIPPKRICAVKDTCSIPDFAPILAPGISTKIQDLFVWVLLPLGIAAGCAGYPITRRSRKQAVGTNRIKQGSVWAAKADSAAVFFAIRSALAACLQAGAMILRYPENRLRQALDSLFGGCTICLKKWRNRRKTGRFS